MVDNERHEQSRLVQKLVQAKKDFSIARRGDASATKDREQALQKLEDAYRTFNELVSNLDTARTFYNNLARITGSFRDSCQDFRHQRRLDADQMESELSNAMSTLNLEKTNSLQEQKEREALRTRYNTRNTSKQAAPSDNPEAIGLQPAAVQQRLSQEQQNIPAPTPTRAPVQPPAPVTAVWNPEMGIKFAGPGAVPPGVPANAQPTAQQLGGGTAAEAAASQHNPPYPNTRNGRWSPGRGLRFS